ncbi:CorA family divalent cation transporter [Chloroflexota bacterium]
MEKDGRPTKKGADFLVHTLIDALIDNVMPTIDRMGEIAGDIEEEAIRRPNQGTLEATLKLKHSTLRIHRVMAPQREVLNRLSRREFSIISEEAQIFYRDIYDHIVRIEDLNQIIRDRADNALATYLSAVANRQNDVMKVLSIVATIFIPLTLVAGIYGMNFEHIPELKVLWAYFAVLGFMGIVIIAFTWFFWFRKWLDCGRGKVTRRRLFAVNREKLRGYTGNINKQSGQ